MKCKKQLHESGTNNFLYALDNFINVNNEKF